VTCALGIAADFDGAQETGGRARYRCHSLHSRSLKTAMAQFAVGWRPGLHVCAELKAEQVLLFPLFVAMVCIVLQNGAYRRRAAGAIWPRIEIELLLHSTQRASPHECSSPGCNSPVSK
jgi:hypothetical protein